MDNELEQIFAAIRKTVADAYERGGQDAVSKIMAAASGLAADKDGSAPNQTPSPERPFGHEPARKRAPRGSVGRLVARVIDEKRMEGAVAADFPAARKDGMEAMIRVSSIRSELQRGESAGEYESRDGRWYPGPNWHQNTPHQDAERASSGEA
jgi:hypothetical protein